MLRCDGDYHSHKMRSLPETKDGLAEAGDALCGLCSDQIAGFHFFEKTFCHIWHKPVVGGDYREEELLSTCQERSSAPPLGSEEM